ncbi:probable galacturonosyltransferase 3 [Chenopodium quinoa]|uniref:Hexosyltransferase n=1 Tax=Chenopodium quinoa TaxID=63459 RepID=A0A803LG17_CHEQI|nr:probable galacturonosyltransferase 3 [Chenopodium quinoa]
MAPRRRRISTSIIAIVIFFTLFVYSSTLIKAQLLQRDRRGYPFLYDCEQCNRKKDQATPSYASNDKSGNLDVKDIDIMVTYSDASGAVRVGSVKAKDLSSSWVWKTPSHHDDNVKNIEKSKDLSQPITKYQDSTEDPVETKQSTESTVFNTKKYPDDPIKRHRQILRLKRRELRTAELMKQDKEMDAEMEKAAIERAEGLDTTFIGKYSIWRRDYDNSNSDSTLKLMRDQIIMAKAYATIAKAKNESSLYNSLMNCTKDSLSAIGEANSDVDLQPSALDQAKAMGGILASAKEKLHDCAVLARKLRAMIQVTEDNVNALKKESAFLIQLAAKTIPKHIHCLSQLLTANYFISGRANKGANMKDKLEDPSLYHYAIFSDNVLAAAVVVNSTIVHANEPEKHVFHIVTDKLKVSAMKMWFLDNPPSSASVEVLNIDDFTWLNSSYCPVLRQLESARMKEFYFKVNNNPSSLSTGTDQLKYRNPKYLSMLNHLRFYLPEVYPKLNKILFLDDDIVVQKDLTPLWSVDMKGMVNGAVETCKESFHRFDKYLNFSNPLISENFDPNACGWAYGMNMFDLKEWRKRNITGIYHYWQELNEDRTLWKLGSLPPGLITFYNLTYPLDRSWHVLGLGYDPALNQTAIGNAAVVHYNGNYKPWLDLAIAKYKSYWSRYVMYDSPYLRHCKFTE